MCFCNLLNWYQSVSHFYLYPKCFLIKCNRPRITFLSFPAGFRTSCGRTGISQRKDEPYPWMAFVYNGDNSLPYAATILDQHWLIMRGDRVWVLSALWVHLLLIMCLYFFLMLRGHYLYLLSLDGFLDCFLTLSSLVVVIVILSKVYKSEILFTG